MEASYKILRISARNIWEKNVDIICIDAHDIWDRFYKKDIGSTISPTLSQSVLISSVPTDRELKPFMLWTVCFELSSVSDEKHPCCESVLTSAWCIQRSNIPNVPCEKIDIHIACIIINV